MRILLPFLQLFFVIWCALGSQPSAAERWANTLSGRDLMLDSRCSSKEHGADGLTPGRNR
jgi:hypothetical protein